MNSGNFLSYKSIYGQHTTIVTPVKGCVNSNYGATNIFGEDCAMYAEGPYNCGQYGDNDFDSDTMCCACGGGINGNTTDLLYDIRLHP